jgi:hypothetical protein
MNNRKIHFLLFYRGYAEEIESRLCCHGLITSTILLREDFTLTEAIENAARLQCLYGIIVMPMHEERRTASFHILYGQTEGERINIKIYLTTKHFRTSQFNIRRWYSYNNN